MNKMLVFKAPEDEAKTWIPILFKVRQGMDESLRLRQVRVTLSPGGAWYNRMLVSTFARVLDTVPEIKEGDLIMGALPPEEKHDFDGGRVMVVVKLLCKAADTACMKEHDAPGFGYGRQTRWLEPGEMESYLRPENFSVYFNKDRELIRPLP